jgi:hypothetical protein
MDHHRSAKAALNAAPQGRSGRAFPDVTDSRRPIVLAVRGSASVAQCRSDQQQLPKPCRVVADVVDRGLQSCLGSGRVEMASTTAEPFRVEVAVEVLAEGDLERLHGDAGVDSGM